MLMFASAINSFSMRVRGDGKIDRGYVSPLRACGGVGLHLAVWVGF